MMYTNHLSVVKKHRMITSEKDGFKVICIVEYQVKNKGMHGKTEEINIS